MSYQVDFFANDNVQMVATYVHQQTGIPTSVLLAQMAIATGYGTSSEWTSCKNPGTKDASGNYPCFSTYQAGADAYAQTWKNGNYASVLFAAKMNETPDAIAKLIGQSTWTTSHYVYEGVVGGLLISLIQTYDLTKYDQAVAVKTSTTTQTTNGCSGIGTLVGSGTSAGLQSGQYLYRTTGSNGETVSTVVDDQCRVTEVYITEPKQSSFLETNWIGLGLVAAGLGFLAYGIFSAPSNQ